MAGDQTIANNDLQSSNAHTIEKKDYEMKSHRTRAIGSETARKGNPDKHPALQFDA